MAGTKIRGITIELSADATGVLTSIENLNGKLKSTTSDLKDVDRLLKFDPTNTTLLSQKTELLQQNIQNCKEKLDALKLAQKNMQDNDVDENSAQYQALQREIAATEQELQTLESTAGSASAKLATFSAKAEVVGEKMENIGNKLMPITVAIAGISTAAVKTAIDFETAFAGVEKTVDGTDSQMEMIRQGIIDMSKETASSATEIAAVAELAGQLGIDTDDILDFTKIMVMLGDTTNLSAEEAASSLAKFANITGLASEDYDNLGSTIVDLGNNYATTESDIVAMATRLASAGTIAGFSVPEILALAASMSSVGIEAEAGGTAMTQTFAAIESAVVDGGDMLSRFANVSGMTATDFADTWENDPITALVAFISGLSGIEEAGGSATEILDSLGLSGIRQSNMLQALALAVGMFSGSVDDANTAWENNNALTEEAEKKYATTEAKLSQAKAALTEAAIAIGDILLPYVQKAAEWIGSLAEKFSNLDEGTQGTILAIAGVVAAIGPLLVVGGKIAKGVSSITSALSSLSFTGALITGVILGCAALAAATKAVTDSWVNAAKEGNLYGELFDDLKNRNDDLYSSLTRTKEAYDDSVVASEAEAAAADALWQKLQSLVEVEDKSAGQKEEIKVIVDKLNELIPDLGLSYDELSDSVNLTNGNVEEHIRLMKEEAQQAAAMDYYTEALKQQYEAQLNYDDALKNVSATLAQYGVDAGQFLELWGDDYKLDIAEMNELVGDSNIKYTEMYGAWRLLEQAGANLSDAEANLAIATDQATQAEGLLDQTVTETTESVEEQATKVTAAEEQTAAAVEQANVAMIESADAFVNAYEQAYGTAIPEALLSAIMAAESAGVEIPQSIADGVVDGTISVQDAIDAITDIMEEQSEAAEEAGTATGEAYVDSASETVDTVRPRMHRAAKDATDEMDTSDEAYQYGSEVASSWSAGVDNSAYLATDSASGMADDVVGEFDDTPAEMFTSGDSSGANMAEGIENELETVRSQLNKMSGYFQSEFRDVADTMYRTGQQGSQMLGSALSSGAYGSVIPAIYSMVSAITSAMYSLPDNMYWAGSMAGQGLYNGLSGWAGALSGLAWSIANSINTAARAALRISSPSKVLTEVGEYAGEGLAIGLENTEGMVIGTARTISNDMVKALSGANAGLNAINSSVNASVSTQKITDPTLSTNANILAILQQYLPAAAADKEIQFNDGTWAGKLAPAINNEFKQMSIAASRG